MDPNLNQQVLGQIDQRITSLDTVINDPNASAAAKADATAAKGQLQEERRLRQRIANAKTDAERQRAERDLAAYRQRTCPQATDGTTVAQCRPTVLFVHLHMRFLLPKQLLRDLRDTGKYPLRVASCPENTFKTKYSFEGQSIPTKTRWSGELKPVVGATVKMAGKTATTDRNGMAKFENVGAGAQTVEIEPPPQMDTTLPAGPELPVASGYSFASAPQAKYRKFSVSATVDGDGRWQANQEPTVTMPHKGDSAAYAGVAGVTAMDLFLDWKPDWYKVLNRFTGTRHQKAVVMHQTATVLHEQIGSPLNWFSDSSGNSMRTSAHYLVDLDGHIVKLVHEEEQARHAGPSHWHELNGLNTNGIGIETVHTDSNTSSADGKLREFPKEQVDAINRLVTKLRTTFSITKKYVCGHNDCKDESRDCPGVMFDWKAMEDAGNALKVHTGGTFSGSRRVTPSAQTADDATIPLSQELYRIGYTNKEVREAIKRFVLRAWSGSRYPSRPTGANLETAPAIPASQGKKAVPAGEQVTQVIADAIDQMYRDVPP